MAMLIAWHTLNKRANLVFHLLGQPQASVAFLEIDDIEAYLRRRTDARDQISPSKNWSRKPVRSFRSLRPLVKLHLVDGPRVGLFAQ